MIFLPPQRRNLYSIESFQQQVYVFDCSLWIQFYSNYFQNLTKCLFKTSSSHATSQRFLSVLHLLNSFFLPLSEMLCGELYLNQHLEEDILQLLASCIFSRVISSDSSTDSSITFIPPSYLTQLSSDFHQVLSLIISIHSRLQNHSQICTWIATLSQALK